MTIRNIEEARKIWGDHGLVCFCDNGFPSADHMEAKGCLDGWKARGAKDIEAIWATDNRRIDLDLANYLSLEIQKLDEVESDEPNGSPKGKEK